MLAPSGPLCGPRPGLFAEPSQGRRGRGTVGALLHGAASRLVTDEVFKRKTYLEGPQLDRTARSVRVDSRCAALKSARSEKRSEGGTSASAELSTAPPYFGCARLEARPARCLPLAGTTRSGERRRS